MRSYLAEFIGTFWLVLGGCGSAVLAAAFPELGIGFTGVSLAFGLTVLTGLMRSGPSPADTSIRRSRPDSGRRSLPCAELLPYVIVQVVGAVVAAAVLYVIASGQAGFYVQAVSLRTAMASTRQALRSRCRPGLRSRADVHVSHRDLGSTTSARRPALADRDRTLLTLIHLINIPVTNLR